jgi:xanthine dehydrogenase YagR molybdenum-binding subunit
MTTATAAHVIGSSLTRVDGHLKVTGAATYPLDVILPGMAHAVLVQSTVTSGRILAIDTTPAERAPGVLAVLTQKNAPRLVQGPMTPIGPSPPPPLQSDVILHFGQHVALVVAETFEQAHAAAPLVSVTYEPGTAIVSIDDPAAARLPNAWPGDRSYGDAAAALASADFRVDATYVTPENTNNPLGLFATVAEWRDDVLTVHDTNQWPHGVRESLAQTFGIDVDRIRVLTPFVGGAFGAGLRVWPHVPLAVLAARVAKRPVKLTLTRAQMFTSIGHRPNSVQRISIGASRIGRLLAIEHQATSSVGIGDDVLDPVTMGTPESYACPNVLIRNTQVRLHIPPPGWMRAPGEAEGSFALESALDELAYELGIDPLELRIRNHAEVDRESGLKWSSDATLDCYRQGAARFGWARRRPTPRSMRDGYALVGYGVARGALVAYQAPCVARASVYRDGTAFVRSAATDIGTGTYTVMTVIASDVLGLAFDRVRFGLGDTEMPNSMQEGGSGLAASLGNAVDAACRSLLRAFVELVTNDERSRLQGCRFEQVSARDGGLSVTGDPRRFESFAEILARRQLDELTRDGASTPPVNTKTMVPAGSFAAHFVEAHVDADLGTIRVRRVVSAVDGGRILNEKTARSQIIGGVAGGIGMALLEETVSDHTGRLVNASFGDYLVAVSADVPDIDVLFVGAPDPLTATGAKGIGELALTGMAAAIANAVYHATGRRVRSLPISVEKVLASDQSA